MNLDTLLSVVARLICFVATALLGLEGVEAAANAFNYTILGRTYSKGRLLELSAILLVFVMTMLLRQIRDALTKR